MSDARFRSVRRALACGALVSLQLGCSNDVDRPRPLLGEAAATTAVVSEAPRSHRQVIDAQAWTPSDWPGIVTAQLELPGDGTGETAPHQLWAGERRLVCLDSSDLADAIERADQLEDGSFLVVGDILYLIDRDGSLRSNEMVYVATLTGVRGSDRVSLGGVTTDGFVLRSGEVRTFEPSESLDGAALVFGAAAYGSPLSTGSLRLRVRVGGREQWSTDIPARLVTRLQRHAVPFSDLGDGGPISFEAEGGPGYAVVSAPVVVPSTGASEVDRPDVVVFIADTFRADNLELWGGDPQLAPNLNRFVDESVAFPQSWAPSPWTLPSHVSMLIGLYPPQHGVMSGDVRLGDEQVTLAHVLARAGYRTVAVTDGVYLTESFGMDRGFESFSEKGRTLASTFERVRRELEVDDGRPLFLFVQSYRVHSPYTVSAESVEQHPELFDPEDDPGAWLAPDRYDTLLVDAMDESSPQRARALEDLERLYRGGVADLDRWFPEFLALLDGALSDDAIVIFTSDHGEAFGEHGDVGHRTSVYEEQVRIPLAIRAPGRAPQRSMLSASLIDLPRTICELVDVAPHPSWEGRSLFGPDADDAIFSFVSHQGDHALIRAEQKLVFTPRADAPAAYRAFDLGRDPAEANDLANRPSDFGPALLSRYGPALENALEARTTVDGVMLGRDQLEDLRAMGYLDGDGE